MCCNFNDLADSILWFHYENSVAMFTLLLTNRLSAENTGTFLSHGSDKILLSHALAPTKLLWKVVPAI